MQIITDPKTIVYPLPTDELLNSKEQNWRLKLPEDYRAFLKQNNGGVPLKNSITVYGHSYMITRYLCVLPNIKISEYGWYDIGVVESQIGERLTDNEDLVGIEILPIAALGV